MRLACIGAAALLACGSAPDNRHPGFAWGETASRALTVCASGPTLAGVDVSHYEGRIDWAAYAASGRPFAIAKATEGLTFKDPMFQTNWTGMKEAGLVRGAYHFFRPQDSGLKQADYFLDTLGEFAAGDLPPILDWEVTDNVANAVDVREVQDFIGEVHARTGLTTILYTSARFLGTVGNPTQFHDLPLWDANWGVSCPNLPNAWSWWTFWQDADNGIVPGIATGVDTDLFNGTMAELMALKGECGDGHFRGAAADIDDERANRLGDRQVGADRGREWLLDQVSAGGAGRQRRLLDRRAFNLGDTAWDANHDVGARTEAVDRAADEVAEHLLRDLEVGDHAVA